MLQLNAGAISLYIFLYIPVDRGRSGLWFGILKRLLDGVSDSNMMVSLSRPALLRNGVTQDLLLGRWRLTLELFGQVFIDDVGAEPGSIIAQLGGFPVKEAKFRREMEKLRNFQQRDLNLTKVSS